MLLFRKHTLFCSEFENTNLFSRFEFYLHNSRLMFSATLSPVIFSSSMKTCSPRYFHAPCSLNSDLPFIVMWNFDYTHNCSEGSLPIVRVTNSQFLICF